MQHRGKRSFESRECRKARQYCLANSFWDSKRHETVYLGDEADVVAAVNLALGRKIIPELIPEIPQGLILIDIRGSGAFQQDGFRL